MTETPKKKPNLIMPTSPMFASIMKPVAMRMVGKLCKTKEMPGWNRQHVPCTKEVFWTQGDGNENLQKATLEVGVVGTVMGVTETGTVLRFLVSRADPDNPVDYHDIYHVNVTNLELVKEEEGEQQT